VRRRLPLVTSIALALVMAACGGPQSRPHPEPAQRLPVPNLNVSPGPHIWSQLRQFQATPGVCRRAVANVDPIRFTPLADTIESQGCGLRNALRLTATLIPISRNIDVSCPMAAALHLWMRDIVVPAARLHLKAKVSRVETFGTYACRARNNQAGARLSEHATANAIDISGFMLSNGRKIMVEQGWRGAADEAAFLRAIHKQSCRTFSVVIGPDGDKYHYNHIHLDMGPWRLCR
jgi:hypothetical protein